MKHQFSLKRFLEIPENSRLLIRGGLAINQLFDNWEDYCCRYSTKAVYRLDRASANTKSVSLGLKPAYSWEDDEKYYEEIDVNDLTQLLLDADIPFIEYLNEIDYDKFFDTGLLTYLDRKGKILFNHGVVDLGPQVNKISFYTLANCGVGYIRIKKSLDKCDKKTFKKFLKENTDYNNFNSIFNHRIKWCMDATEIRIDITRLYT